MQSFSSTPGQVTGGAQPKDLSLFKVEIYVKKNPLEYQCLENHIIFASLEETQIQDMSVVTLSTQATSVSFRNMTNTRY